MKKEMFYNCSQPEMIRTLTEEGGNAIKDGKQRDPGKTACVSVHKEQGKYTAGILFRKETVYCRWF